jgi:hypothetical protein
VVPPSEVPATAASPKIAKPELETHPKNKLQYILDTRMLQPVSLDSSTLQSTLELLEPSDCLAKPCVDIWY